MATDFIRSTDLVRAQLAEYERLAWFLFGCLERERKLNVEALLATPSFAAMMLLSAMQPFVLFPASMFVISAAK